jgi:hypothetical protein
MIILEQTWQLQYFFDANNFNQSIAVLHNEYVEYEQLPIVNK